MLLILMAGFSSARHQRHRAHQADCRGHQAADTHNLVVCTLCSCYPLSILGLSPSWYKDIKYRARCVRAPRACLAEFSTALPEATAVRVHDSTTARQHGRWPLRRAAGGRPSGTEGWSEAELASLVPRDSIIGVTTRTFLR